MRILFFIVTAVVVLAIAVTAIWYWLDSPRRTAIHFHALLCQGRAVEANDMANFLEGPGVIPALHEPEFLENTTVVFRTRSLTDWWRHRCEFFIRKRDASPIPDVELLYEVKGAYITASFYRHPLP